ncbi:hypothetical protein [Caballeronia sp. TF1N1]|uniref:hypothetical protein n=1 Tax=Caballeronia sp. TF1N1 TaxID=2878153 RepID=UPI001FD3040B|nr:hypothetical protein [Caballeronia sp. TF1N1]
MIKEILEFALKPVFTLVGTLAGRHLGLYLTHGGPLRLHTNYTGVLKFRDRTTAQIHLEIPKPGARFRGSMTTSEDGKPVRTYVITGSFNFDTLTFEFRASNERRPSRGAGALKVTNDNRRLEGYIIYRHDTRDEVRSIRCELTANEYPA